MKNQRTFWDDVDMTKTLYSRYAYLNKNFRIILKGETAGPDSSTSNKELLDTLFRSKVRPIRQEQRTEFYELCRWMDKFYTEFFLPVKGTTDRWTERDLYVKGYDENRYKILLKSLSEFIAWMCGLIIPEHIKAIYRDIKPEPGIEEMKEYLEIVSLEDLACNPSPRFPVMFIIDNSVYMGENGLFDGLHDAMNAFFDEIVSNSRMLEMSELYIATCGGGHTEIVNFARLDRQLGILEKTQLKPYGRCFMGDAINASLDQLEKRINQMTKGEIDVQYYCPWMIILSNGRFKDKEQMDKACARLKGLKENRRIQVYPIGLTDDADMNQLLMLDEKEATILTTLNGFFNDVFYSMCMARHSSPGGDSVTLVHPEGFKV